VRPLLEYGCELWGEKKWAEAELIQRSMGKFILGAPISMTNEAVLGELGWVPLVDRRLGLRLRYWHKLINMREGRLVKEAYEMERERNGKWAKVTKEGLYKLGLGEFWESQRTRMSQEKWAELLEGKLKGWCELEWKKRMSMKPKLRRYAQRKEELKYERYLDCGHMMGRSLLTRLRTGSSWLRLEMGRRGRLRLERVVRTCEVCWLAVEDGLHFLRECEGYKDLREEAEREIREEWSKRLLVVSGEREWESLFWGEGDQKTSDTVMRYIARAAARRDRVLGTKVYRELKRRIFDS